MIRRAGWSHTACYGISGIGLSSRVPYFRGHTSKGRAPARRPGFIMDGHLTGADEGVGGDGGGIPLEIDAVQLGAVFERIGPDAGDAAADDGIGETAGTERATS